MSQAEFHAPRAPRPCGTLKVYGHVPFEPFLDLLMAGTSGDDLGIVPFRLQQPVEGFEALTPERVTGLCVRSITRRLIINRTSRQLYEGGFEQNTFADTITGLGSLQLDGVIPLHLQETGSTRYADNHNADFIAQNCWPDRDRTSLGLELELLLMAPVPNLRIV